MMKVQDQRIPLIGGITVSPAVIVVIGIVAAVTLGPAALLLLFS